MLLAAGALRGAQAAGLGLATLATACMFRQPLCASCVEVADSRCS